MIFDYSIYYVFLALSCIITASLGMVALQRSMNRGAVAFAGLMFSAALYSFSYIFKSSSMSVYKAYFWIKVAYAGIVGIPVFWYIMVLRYTGAGNELTGRKAYILFIIPSITILILLTNSYHHMYYSNLLLIRPGSISMLYFEKGPWYWIQFVYAYILFISGYYRLLKEWWHSDKAYRRRLGIFAAGAIVPWITNLLYHLRITPKGIDLSPASFAVAGLVFTLGIYRYGVFDLVPIARNCVFETIRDGVIVLDLHNRVVDFNAEAKGIMRGIADLEIGQLFKKELKIFGIASTDLNKPNEQREAKIVKENEMIYYSCILSPVMNKKNSMVGKTLILRNITEQIRLQENLSILATRDGLTNIYNRRYFLELGNKKLKQGINKAQSLAIILFDIDLFKNINDTYGHEAGDVVLCRVAEACAASLRNMDIYARYGGEEFICMLPNISAKSAIKIAERIQSNIACIPLSFHGDTVKITASFGVSGTDLSDEAGLEELINMADKALYDAKRQGRNRTCIYEIGIS